MAIEIAVHVLLETYFTFIEMHVLHLLKNNTVKSDELGSAGTNMNSWMFNEFRYQGKKFRGKVAEKCIVSIDDLFSLW